MSPKASGRIRPEAVDPNVAKLRQATNVFESSVPATQRQSSRVAEDETITNKGYVSMPEDDTNAEPQRVVDQLFDDLETLELEKYHWEEQLEDDRLERLKSDARTELQEEGYNGDDLEGRTEDQIAAFTEEGTNRLEHLAEHIAELQELIEEEGHSVTLRTFYIELDSHIRDNSESDVWKKSTWTNSQAETIEAKAAYDEVAKECDRYDQASLALNCL
ncbi:hypothetical protein CYMTET_31209 [Cymbomonas tetramitiformis]|uniref:Uncharacterized protein n=1 Tax=Cymbomonas tetramitiformis TaxID=36881 RepID=A0AAE0FH87_9CHLO|nr:hypothetical protein CYMTET_31209 [Cymbomonas tetramitiformis]